MWRYRRRYALGMLSLLFVDAINVALPLVVKEGIDALVPGKASRVVWAGAIYFTLMVLQAFGRYAWRIFLIGTSHLIATDLRDRLYAHLQRLPLAYYQRVRTGDLMSRATNDVESIRMAVGPGILVSADAVLMFGLIVPVMFWQSWKLSVLCFLFYPLVPWLTATLGDRIDVLYEDLQRRMSGLGAFAQESYAGIRLIKSLVLEPRLRHRFHDLSLDYEKDGVKLAGLQAMFSPALGLITNLGTLLILIVGGKEVLDGALSIGTFVAFQRFVTQLSWPMEAIGWTVTMHREGAAAFRRWNEILAAPEVEDVRASSPATTPGAAPVLALRRLEYQYPLAAKETRAFRLELDGLEVEAGKKVGIVGPVGAGKTTLFNLILRLHEPAPGSVFVGGRDVASIPLRELRRSVAGVEQQVFLFSETVAANVALGSAAVATAELDRLAGVAGVAGEIAELENGFGSRLGERGVDLSGGQKQRIALMRALARRPELLLLDDCFSAVDVAVEKHIIGRFLEEYAGLTVLLATHRLSVMPRLDEIWVLEGGRLVARGTHARLLAGNRLYERLWDQSEKKIERERLDLVDAVEEEGTA